MPTTKKVNKIMKPHRFHPDVLKMAAVRCKELRINRSEYLSELIKLDSESKILKPKK